MSDANEKELIHLTVDGQAVAVPKGKTVYNAIQKLGIVVPVFCYQDRMPPFGACRVCLVEVEKMGKLQTSCSLEATEGMVVKTQSDLAVKGREGILELLLINHPLDCPICDKGGECPLQENALNHGPGQSRFFESKRHFKKALPLGPLLMLDRERCIVCARCTRFGEIVSGDHALELISRGYKTEVGTPDSEPVKSKFIGNTIMICPVGALTSQVYRFRARPWDNEVTLSSCTLCPVGCSYTLDSRDGEVMRTRACENRDVNDIWLCDKGWFGYEHADHPERLKHPLKRVNGKLETTTWNEALNLIATKMIEAKDGGKVAAFGGNPLTLEENDLYQQLIRQGTGSNHLDHRIGTPIFALEEEGKAPGMEMSIGECESLSNFLLLGCDITEEFPVIWLRLNQAMNQGAKGCFIGHFAPEIAPHLKKTILHAPGRELETLHQHLSEAKGAVFVGRQYLATPQRREILQVLLEAQKKNPSLKLNIMEGRNNSMGARLAGMRPEVGHDGRLLDKPGFNARQVIEAAAAKGWDFLYVAGADPVKKYPSPLWDQARKSLGFMVVQDLFLTETALQADVVLPTLCSYEKTGTFLNIEGRAQKIKAGKKIPEGIYSDAEIFFRLARMLKMTIGSSSFAGECLKDPVKSNSEKIDLEEKGNSNDLLATFAHVLFDDGYRMKHNPHLKQVVKEARVRLHPEEGELRGLKDGEKVKMSAHGVSISANIALDPRVAKGTIVLPLGCDQIPVHQFGGHFMNGLRVALG